MVLSAKVRKDEKVVGFPAATTKPKRSNLKFKLKGPSVILLILLGFLFYSFGGQVVEMYNVQKELKNIQVQMDDLRTKNADLRKQVEQLNSAAYVEREAREKLGLVKPGEKVILEAKPGAKGRVLTGNAKDNENVEIH